MKNGDENEKRKKNKKRKRGDDSDDEFDPIKYQQEKKQKVAKKKAEVHKTPSQLAKERALQELTKVSLVQAKLAKIKNRPSRVTAAADDDDFGKGKNNSRQKNKKRLSRFEKDLTDTSKTGVKKLRLVFYIHRVMRLSNS